MSVLWGVSKSHGALNLPLWHWGQNFFLSKKKKSFLSNCHTKKFHKRESILVKLYILDESHSFNISIFNFRKNLTTFFVFALGSQRLYCHTDTGSHSNV